MQRTWRVLSACALPVLAWLLTACSHHADPASHASASKPHMTPAELVQAGYTCLRENYLDCAEKDLRSYLGTHPNDTDAIEALGTTLNRQGRDHAAVVEFEKAIDLGDGSYMMFGNYADSLGKVGRIDDAIDWSYKTLKIMPTLVDVRGNLAKLLVMKKRYYEALTVLGEYDDYLKDQGQSPYFEAQRIAIMAALQRNGTTRDVEGKQIRLVKLRDHYYAPVEIGVLGITPFIVDNGSNMVVLNDGFLVRSKARYTIKKVHDWTRLADGRKVDAKLVVIDNMHVGPYELDNVRALVCPHCELLLGENALSRFDTRTTRAQGVSTLTLSPRQ